MVLSSLLRDWPGQEMNDSNSSAFAYEIKRGQTLQSAQAKRHACQKIAMHVETLQSAKMVTPSVWICQQFFSTNIREDVFSELFDLIVGGIELHEIDRLVPGNGAGLHGSFVVHVHHLIRHTSKTECRDVEHSVLSRIVNPFEEQALFILNGLVE